MLRIQNHIGQGLGFLITALFVLGCGTPYPQQPEPTLTANTLIGQWVHTQDDIVDEVWFEAGGKFSRSFVQKDDRNLWTGTFDQYKQTIKIYLKWYENDNGSTEIVPPNIILVSYDVASLDKLRIQNVLYTRRESETQDVAP